MPTEHNTLHEQILAFFTKQLSRIYFGKQHVISKLPELQQLCSVRSLCFALEEMREDLQRQVTRIELIFELLDQPLQHKLSKGIIGLMENAFEEVTGEPGNFLRDMSIIYYLQHVESLEMSGFKLLRMAAVKIKKKQVKQLLVENYDEAKASRTLLLLIAAERLAG